MTATSKNQLKWAIVCVVIVLAGIVFYKKPIQLGLDLQGGTRLVLEGQEKAGKPVDEDALSGTLEVIRTRIDSLGVAEPVIRRKGRYQLIVELPGIKNPEHAIQLIGETALLEFVEAEWAPDGVASLPKEKLALLAGEEARIDKLSTYDDKGRVISERYIILKHTALTGADLVSALPATDAYSQPAVGIEFNAVGTEKFRQTTAKNVGKPLAILLDKKLISAPQINEAIGGGKAQISGHFTVQEMRELVMKLKAGSLPVPVKIISKTVVGPTLGKDSIEKSKWAGILGFIGVCVFMIGIYRVPGVLACVALGIYTFLCISVLKLFGATLTLTGIAGLILSLGIALDANIIIFERIKEERRAGYPLLQSIQTGFQRAFITVLDANLANLLAATVLFWLGTGSIRGFALTLSIGVLVSMFTSVMVTRVLIEWVLESSPKASSLLFKGPST